MCSCGKGAVIPVRTFATAAAMQHAQTPIGDESVEQVTFILPAAGWYTVDSGNRYRSWGTGTRATVLTADRPSLEHIGLIEPVKV